MYKINIIEKKKDEGWLFKVEIDEGGSKSSHSVELFKKDYERLTDTKIEPKELIEKSFDFLLRRESKESILNSFNLMDIARYFPEYENEIKARGGVSN